MNFGGVKSRYLSLFMVLSCFSSGIFAASPSAHKAMAMSSAMDKEYLRHLKEIENRDYKDVVKIGVKLGIIDGALTIVGQSIEAVTGPLVEQGAKPVVNCIKYPFKLTSKWFHLIVFGSRRLAWNDVARINNTVFELIQPMTVQSIGDFTKERRADIIGAQNQTQVVDNAWLLKKRYLIKELDQIIEFAQGKLSCYSVSNVGLLRKLMGAFYALLTTEQRGEMSTALDNALECCIEMRNLIDSCNSSKQIEEYRDTLKFLLSRALKGFKTVAGFINEEMVCQPAGSHQPGYMKLNELSGQGAGGLGGLDQLFADANNGSSGN